MTRFNQGAYNQFVLNNNVVGIKGKSFTLKSGRTSHWYANWRIPTNDTWATEQLSTFIRHFIGNINNFVEGFELRPDCFFGVPEGATKLATITGSDWARKQVTYDKGSHPLPMGRGKPKEHGAPEDKYFVGTPKGRVIVLEDVTTTGGSLLNTIANLRELSSVEVIAAIGLTNRMELTPIPEVDDAHTYVHFSTIFNKATGLKYHNQKPMSVKQAVDLAGVPYFALSKATELLPLVIEREGTNIDLVQAIEKEFQKFGAEPLQLGGK